MAIGNVPLLENNNKHLTRNTKHNRFPKPVPEPGLSNPGSTFYRVSPNKTRPIADSATKRPKLGHFDRKHR